MRMTQQLLMIEDDSRLAQMVGEYPVSYTHLTLPTNREV